VVWISYPRSCINIKKEKMKLELEVTKEEIKMLYYSVNKSRENRIITDELHAGYWPAMDEACTLQRIQNQLAKVIVALK